jgi:hypothetical protein
VNSLDKRDRLKYNQNHEKSAHRTVPSNHDVRRPRYKLTMNYGEELAYWYLRLNGFFPLVDFVMHGGAVFERTTDCDVLAVRPPHVFEEVGGQPHDWDGIFQAHLDGHSTLGIICQAKTGKYEYEKLFREPHVLYAIERLGLCTDPTEVSPHFVGRAVIEASPDVRLIKLLIAKEPLDDANFFCLTVSHIRGFIRERLERYNKIKYRDRHFFPSDMLQNFIDETHNEPIQ